MSEIDDILFSEVSLTTLKNAIKQLGITKPLRKLNRREIDSIFWRAFEITEDDLKKEMDFKSQLRNELLNERKNKFDSNGNS